MGKGFGLRAHGLGVKDFVEGSDLVRRVVMRKNRELGTSFVPSLLIVGIWWL